MSTILKALRRLEEEREEAARDLRGQVVARPKEPEPRPRLPLLVAAGAVGAVLVIGAFLTWQKGGFPWSDAAPAAERTAQGSAPAATQLADRRPPASRVVERTPPPSREPAAPSVARAATTPTRPPVARAATTPTRPPAARAASAPTVQRTPSQMLRAPTEPTPAPRVARSQPVANSQVAPSSVTAAVRAPDPVLISDPAPPAPAHVAAPPPTQERRGNSVPEASRPIQAAEAKPRPAAAPAATPSSTPPTRVAAAAPLVREAAPANPPEPSIAVAAAPRPQAPVVPAEPALRAQPGIAGQPQIARRAPLPRMVVSRTLWHPREERRVAYLDLEGREGILELHEGDAVGDAVVKQIDPSGVVFLHRGIEIRRRVGATE